MNRWFDHLPIIGNKVPGKVTLSFLMLLFAILMWTCFRTSDRAICVLAMLFSFVGDICLNHNRNHAEQSKKDFIIGGIAFILAHISYCIAYSQKILANQFPIFNFGFVLAILILVVTTLFVVICSKATQQSKLFVFGIAYLWITGINYITIFSYSYSAKSIAILGGLLFLASDVIIGLEKFSGLNSKIARELVWWFYPIGQIILITMA